MSKTDTLDAIAREKHVKALAEWLHGENVDTVTFTFAVKAALTALSNQGEGAVAIAEVISGYEFGDSGAESKVRWLLNPMPVGAYLYEQPDAEADRRDAEAWLYEYPHDGEADHSLSVRRFLPSWIDAKKATETPLYRHPSKDTMDAIRYRWARASKQFQYWLNASDEAATDAAIDAAIAATQEQT